MKSLLSQRWARPLACNQVVFLADRQAVTWGEFSDRVCRLADWLAARPEKRRWILADGNLIDFSVALWAVWHSGGHPVLPPSQQPGAIDSIRRHADSVLAAGELRSELAHGQTGRALGALDPEACALDLYTSGSTGEPKCVSKKLRQLEAEVEVLEGLWGGEETVLATVPHMHIYGLLFRLLWPLASGRVTDAQVCESPEIVLARVQQYGPAILVSSPSHLGRMPELIDLQTVAPRLARVFSSGAPLPAETAGQFLRATGRAPTEVLGSTETGGLAWRERRADDLWTLLPGVTACAGDGGALEISSPFLPAGASYASQDAVEFAADGRFRLLGRLDRIVKIEGKRLSLPAMESQLACHEWIVEAALVVLEGKRQAVAAVVALNTVGQAVLEDKGRQVVARELRGYLVHWFDRVLLPRKWRYVACLPRDARGKLSVQALRHSFERAGEVVA